jgi:hypothetical protein
MKKVLHKLLTALTLILVLASCEDLTGLQGPQGANGKDGANGQNGANGEKGDDAIVRDTAYAVSAALAEKTGGDDEPWTVTVSGVDISDPDAFRHLFNGIAMGIEEGDLALDLSECTGTFFAQVSGINLADKSRLVSIILPASLTHIVDGSEGFGAFHNYKRLGRVRAPGLIYIGNYAFNSSGESESYNEALTEIDFPEVLRVGDHAFLCQNLSSISLPKAVHIGAYAFEGNASSLTLTAVDLPSVQSIGDYAFHSWRSIASINLPELETIGDDAFAAIGVNLPNVALTALNLPKCKTIGAEAFLSCDALVTAELPAVTSIGDAAFYGCTALESFKLGPVIPSAPDMSTLAYNGIFASTGSNGAIMIDVPFDKKNDYEAAGWKSIAQNAVATGTINYGTSHKEIIISTYE